MAYDETGKGFMDSQSILIKRSRLPNLRAGATHKGCVNGREFYLTCNPDKEDGRPRELFIRMAQEGHGYDQWAIAVSLIWQMDPFSVEHTVRKFAFVRDGSGGFTKNKHFPMVSSIYDYVMKWIALEFLPKETAESVGVKFDEDEEDKTDEEVRK